MKGILSYQGILSLFLGSVAIALVSDRLLVLAAIPLFILLAAGFTKPAIFYYLLLFSIPLSTEYQFSTTLGTDLPDETLMWVLTPLIVFMLLRNRWILEDVLKNRIMILILVSLCWTMITVFFSQTPLTSLKYLLAKIWYVVPFVIGTSIFLQDQDDLLLAAKLLLFPMLFTVVVIMVRHGSEGFSFETINDVTAPFFRNHVNYGALLVCLLPVAWALYRSGNKGWLMVLAILLTGLVFSYSRGAWLALISGLVVVYFTRRNAVQWLVSGVAIVVLAASFWVVDDNRYLRYRPQYEKTIYHASFDEHMAATYRMQDMSTVERFYRWIAAVKMAKENWLTGSGPNSFYPLYKSYTANDFRTYVSDNPERSTVHNYFLLLITEQGVPGLLLFAALYIAMLMRAQKIYRNSTDKHTRGLMLVIASVLGMIGVLIFLSDLIETDKIGSVFYICAGLLLVRETVLDREIER